MSEKDKKNTEITVVKGNLTPWIPGQSGNPAGRPVGTKNGLRSRLLRMLDQTPEADILKVFEAKGIKLVDKDNAEVIAHVVGREAKKGNMMAVKIITEQTEFALPKEVKLEHTGRVTHDHQPISRTLEILEEFTGKGEGRDPSESLPN